MKKAAIIISVLVFVSSFVGCGKNKQLRYEECIFLREEHYENWVVESLDGVSAEVKKASSEELTVKLSNNLEHEIQFSSWSRAFVYRDGVWYTVLPPEDIVTPSVGTESNLEEEAARTLFSGESKEFTYDFPESYQGVSLPTGEYRMRMGIKYPSPRANDPSGLMSGDVWVDFTIE